MKINKIKEKMTLNPIMTFMILIFSVMLLSLFLNFIGFEATYSKLNTNNGEYIQTTETVSSLLSINGLKYIFSTTVSNFASFTPLSMLIISLIGIGVMEKSGFLKTTITLLTKKSKKTTITFVWVLICMILSLFGDLSYVVMIPLSALLFSYGRRNPMLGIVSTFAALSCGQGISIFFTSVDSSLTKLTLQSTHILDKGYTFGTNAFIFIMAAAIILMSIIITQIAEKHTSTVIERYEYKEEKKEFKLGKKEIRGLIFSLSAGFLYLIFFLYNIIPGLPFSGKLLDDSQVYYIDKLFSYDSFFSNGFVFIIMMLFIILGLFYGLGARTIKDNNDLCDDLGHSLDGTGKIFVIILFASVLVNVFKYSNIGTVVVASLANILKSASITNIPLIATLFIIGVLSTILLPNSAAKWTLIATTAVPAFMNSGMSPEFAQTVFRFSECVTMGITPLFAYFVIYLAYIEKYNQNNKPIPLLKTIKYQLPYSLASFIVLLLLAITWYLIGLPLGLGSTIVV